VADNKISVGGFISFSIENIVKHWLKFIGLTIIFGAAYLVCMVITSLLMASGNGILSFLGFLAAIVSVAVMATMSFGFLKNILNLCRGQAVDFGAFIQVKPMVILNFIIAMVIVGTTVFTGMLLFVIPGIILAYLLLLTPYLIIDREIGPIKAIDESYNRTKDHLLDMFIVTFIGSVILSLLSVFIITLVITIPMMCLMCVYLYLRLTGQLDDAAPKRADAPPVEPPAPEQPAPEQYAAAEEEATEIDTETRAVDAARIEAARGGSGQA